MDRSVLFAALLAAGLFLSPAARADGCFLCEGKVGTYVRFKGEDSWDKRKKAEACGCKVAGTTSSCGAANHQILCSVAGLPVPSDARPVAASR
ncbi:MAG: hypothetical protein EXR72_17170 [Myxococcales bacterium]|nr:hypothetical protein [Myxococcales bacterium]